MKCTLLFSLLASASLAYAQIPALPSWTASDGRVIQAKFIKLDGEAVVIEMNGKPFTVPFARLSPASVAQAKKAALANRPKREPITPAATSSPGEPQVLSLRETMFTEGWLADGSKGGFSKLLSLHCDDMGDLVLPVGTLTEHGTQRGLVKLSGYDGSVVWAVSPADLAEGAWLDFNVVKDSAGDWITAVASEGADKSLDVIVSKVAGPTGKVMWKWRFDGAQHGNDVPEGIAADASGNVLIAITSGGKPVPGDRGMKPRPDPATLDSVVVKLDGTTGKPVWETREHAVSGTKDIGLLCDTQPAGVVLMRHDKDKAPGQLLGIDAATGKVLWQVAGGGKQRNHLTAHVTSTGILHTDGKNWMLTSLNGKNLWSKPMLFNEYETLMAGGESSVWIDWLLQDIKKDVVNYTSTVGLLQLKDGAVSVKKEPLAGPADLANPAPPMQLEYPYYAGVQDKSGDLLFVACGPIEGERYTFKPKLSRISAKDGSVLWTKALDTVAAKNPGYKPFYRLDSDGNLLYLWQEDTRLEVTVDGRKNGGQGVISLAKFSPADGSTVWHQRIAGALGGTVSATNWQLDAAGNVFVVFSAPGIYGAGVAGSHDTSMNAIKFNGASGAVEWLRTASKVVKIEFAPGTAFKPTAKESAASVRISSAKFADADTYRVMVALNNATIGLGVKQADFRLNIRDVKNSDVSLRLESITLAAFLEKLAELTQSTLEWTDKEVILVGKPKP